MNTLLFAVRHGETEWNSIEKYQGHLDSPLTDNGIKQAQLLANGLIAKNIDLLYSSDLGRALQTAKIIAKKISLPIHSDARLRERHLGLIQGLTKKEFAEKYPQEAALFNTGDPDYIVPGGESARQRFRRCLDCAEDLARHNLGQRILIVAHGGVLSSFFYQATNTPLTEPRRFSLFNASINAFSISAGQWHLNTWGEITHLSCLSLSSQTSSHSPSEHVA